MIYGGTPIRLYVEMPQESLLLATKEFRGILKSLHRICPTSENLLEIGVLIPFYFKLFVATVQV